MRKMITCSFEKGHIGGFITINNGVHPDKEGHYSKTIAITREKFNEACQDRHLFSEILGVDITMGWQNPLVDAIKNCSPLKTEADPVIMAETVIKGNIAEHGIEVVEKDMQTLQDSLDEEEKAIEDAMKKSEKKAKTTKKKVKDGKGKDDRADSVGKVEAGTDGEGVSGDGESTAVAE